MKLYKTNKGQFLKLVRVRPSGLNTFVEVDEKGQEIKEKRCWSTNKQTQERLIKNFKNIIEIKT